VGGVLASDREARKVEPIVPNRLTVGPGQRVGDNAFHLVVGGGLEPPRLVLPRGLGRLWRRTNGYPWRRRRALVLSAAEAENWEKNDSQQSNTDSEPGALAKTFCQVDAKYNPDDDIH
jgi:hypothetical protein